MTPDQVDLLEHSFARLAEDAAGLARGFYARLFAVAPAVRPLFPADVSEQERKLVAELAAIVGCVRERERLVARAEALGRRHVGYGARPAHYEVVGAVLLATIEERLGPDPDVLGAWSEAFGLLSSVMQGAAAAV